MRQTKQLKRFDIDQSRDSDVLADPPPPPQKEVFASASASAESESSSHYSNIQEKGKDDILIVLVVPLLSLLF